MLNLPQHKVEDILKIEGIIIYEEIYSLVMKSYNFKIWGECYQITDFYFIAFSLYLLPNCIWNVITNLDK